MKILITTLILTFLLPAAVSPALAQSATDLANKSLQEAVDQAYGGGESVNYQVTTFNTALINVINTLLTFTGVLFFLLVIYAGWLWMSARGKEEDIEKAKKMLRQALIGLLIIIMSRLLTEVILYQLEQASSNSTTVSEEIVE